MHGPLIETATRAHLPGLWELECACFEHGRRSSRRSLRHSLASRNQIVRFVREGADTRIAASCIIRMNLRTWRLYSIAVAPHRQGRGLGGALVRDAFDLAAGAGAVRISLEVDALDGELLSWYERHGFRVMRRLADYYGPGRPALRMLRTLTPANVGSE
jgi:ribosomal protein S18 acetylase RimI-like enzyme